MKVTNIKQIQKLDPEDIRLCHGDKEREVQRKKLINRFVTWSWKN
jgi:hypothetical protein